MGDTEFYRATEVQDGSRGGPGRGALHHHLVLSTLGQLDVLRVQQLALDAGYGCVIDVESIDAGTNLDHLAGYVSKRIAGYVTKGSGDHRQEVPWRADVADRETGEITRMHSVPTFRAHSQSAGWGCTLKEIRAICREQARARAAVLAEHLALTLEPAAPAESVAMACADPPPG